MHFYYRIAVKKNRSFDPHKYGEDNKCIETYDKLGVSGVNLDMLRYDDGKVVETKDDEVIIESAGYTEGRWRSFGQQPRVISVAKLKDKEYLSKAFENRLWFTKVSMELLESCGSTGSEERVGSMTDILQKAYGWSEGRKMMDECLRKCQISHPEKSKFIG